MKDPAALLYIDKWITATTEMKADARAYYMDLILFQFDKGSIPNDIEELANICRVRFSEFKVFEQVFEQVLKQKFVQNDNGRLINEFSQEIIQKRKKFIDKRSNSGKLSYIIRYARKHLKATPAQIDFIKKQDNLLEIDTKNEQVLKQVLEQILELYINIDEDVNIDSIKDKEEYNSGNLEMLKDKFENNSDFDRNIIVNTPDLNPDSLPDYKKRFMQEMNKLTSMGKGWNRNIEEIKDHFSSWLNIQIIKNPIRKTTKSVFI